MRGLILALILTVAGGCTSTTTLEGTETGTKEPDDNAMVHTRLAMGYLQRNQFETALEELNQALSISPNHSASNYVMAMLQTRLGEMEKADGYYRRALRSDPQNSRAAHDYGVFLCGRGQVERALEYFDQALQNPLYQGQELTLLRAGECLITMRTDRRSAEKYFREALEHNPRSGAALYYLADILYARQQFFQARAYIERYFSDYPDSPPALLLAAKIEKRLGAKDKFEEYSDRLRANFPGSDEAKQLRLLQ